MPEVLYGAGGGFNLTAPQSVQTQGIFSGGVSNLGNTAGTTGLVTNRVILVGGSNVTLSQSSGVNGATVTINGAAGGTGGGAAPASRYFFPAAGMALQTFNPAIVAFPQGSYNVQYAPIYYPVAFSRMDVVFNAAPVTAVTAATAAAAISQFGGIYSKSGATLMSIVTGSTQQTLTWASNTAGYTDISSARLMSIPLASTLQPGEYYVAFGMSSSASSIGTATTALGLSGGYIRPHTNASANFSWLNATDFGAASANSTNVYGGAGQLTVAISSAATELSLSDIGQAGTIIATAGLVFGLRNL